MLYAVYVYIFHAGRGECGAARPCVHRARVQARQGTIVRAHDTYSGADGFGGKGQ
jgi:hypothetical protein